LYQQRYQVIDTLVQEYFTCYSQKRIDLPYQKIDNCVLTSKKFSGNITGMDTLEKLTTFDGPVRVRIDLVVLYARMRALKLRQFEVAEQLGCSAEFLSRLLRGQDRIDYVRWIPRLCLQLGLAISDVVTVQGLSVAEGVEKNEAAEGTASVRV
jgi:hypothetical protein